MRKAKTTVLTSAEGRRFCGELLDLHDHALEELEDARDAILRGDMLSKGDHVSAAIETFGRIGRLMDGRPPIGLARRMDVLYAVCATHIALASAELDAGKIGDVIARLRLMRDAVAEGIPQREKKARVLKFRS